MESGEFRKFNLYMLLVFPWGNKPQAGDMTSQIVSGWWSCCLTVGN